MSIQRWTYHTSYPITPDEDGPLVTYADHVAAVAALIDDQAKEIEQYVKAVAHARDKGYAAAREAVAALWVHEVTDVPGWGIDETHVWPSKAAALAAIDALRGAE